LIAASTISVMPKTASSSKVRPTSCNAIGVPLKVAGSSEGRVKVS
jgi:hypothetical protein